MEEKVISEKVFQQLYSNEIFKPARSGPQQIFSFVVIFKTKDDGIREGQYNYRDNTWDYLPSKSGRPQIKDEDVEYWFLHPNTPWLREMILPEGVMKKDYEL